MVVIGNGLVVSAAHAQGQGTDPAAGPAADRFRLPSTADLAADTARTVVDVPAAPVDEIDLTPVIEGAQETVDALPATDWDLTALAGTLSDTDAAFAVVRDRIGFDAYRGLLRGAQGTLGARAGNAFDRAALLKALLDAQKAKTRYAFGTLDADAASALVARSFEPPAEPLPAADAPFAEDFETSVETRARRDNALLATALGDRSSSLAADATDAATADVSHHAWVQVLQADGSWLDLDPTLPDARPGDTLTPVEGTSDSVPADETHTVGFRVVAEMLEGGDLVATPALDETIPAWAAADERIMLTFTTPATSGGMLNPGGLFGGGGNATAWSPTLLIDYAAWDGDPILLQGEVGGGGLLGPGKQADLASLSLDITIGVPGRDPQVVRHVIADRLTASQRSAGAVTAAELAPVATDDDGTPIIFRSIVHPMVSTGGTDPRTYATDLGFATKLAAWGAANAASLDDMSLNEALVPQAVSDQAIVVASEQRFISSIDDDQVRAYVAEPRVYLASRSLDPIDPTRWVQQTDIVRDGIRTLPRQDASADATARHQLWYGALAGAFETQYGLANAAVLDPAARSLEGVSLEMSQPLSVQAGPEVALPLAAGPDLVSIIGSGGMAIVPGDVPSARTWWEVASDGTTRSVLAPRSGGFEGVGSKGSGYKVFPVPEADKPRDQRKQKDEDGNANEYGTVVNKVSRKVEKASRAIGRLTQDGFDDVAEPLIKLK
jgi:transglutaminase-like putative cysteine protease